MSSCTLYRGDCLEIMPTLEPKSVDMVFADLPYSVTKLSWDSPVDIVHLFARLNAITTPNATSVFTATYKFGLTIAAHNLNNLKYDLIWEKPRPTGFLQAKHAPLRAHEQLLVFNAGKPVYNPQMTDAGKPSNRQSDYRSLTASDQTHVYGKLIQVNPDRGNFRYPRSVLKINNVQNKGAVHPSQKPVALLEWLVKTYTNEGDTVFDPVFGSATTAVACARLNRHFVGIEKDPDYFQIGTDRVNAERAALGLPPAVIHSP